jgi:hypothetical protein
VELLRIPCSIQLSLLLLALQGSDGEEGQMVAYGGIIPEEHDARQLKLLTELGKAKGRLSSFSDQAHKMAGDRKSATGRRYAWQMTDGAAIRSAGQMTSHPDAAVARAAADLMTDVRYWEGEISRLSAGVLALEAAWREHQWERYFPCLNSDGHIHASLRGCSTVRHDTAMGWETGLSGRPVAAAIAALGPRLCSVCFPGAPAEHCRSLSDITRADREAEKARKAAEKAAADAVKLLAGDERFTSRRDGDRITKVTELKALIRKAVEDQVELEWLNDDNGVPKTGWDPEFLARRRVNQARYALEAGEDAAQAERILLAREAAHPGWGLTVGDIAKMRANKERSERKAYEI